MIRRQIKLQPKGEWLSGRGCPSIQPEAGAEVQQVSAETHRLTHTLLVWLALSIVAYLKPASLSGNPPLAAYAELRH